MKQTDLLKYGGNMKKKLFDRGVDRNDPAWDELYELLNSKGFSVLDMLACVCTNLCYYKDTEFKTTLGCGGYVWNVKITKDKKVN